MMRSLDQSRMILSGASGHFSHVEALLAYLCIGTRTQRLYTCDFSSFFPKFKKSAKREFSQKVAYFFGFYSPKIGGGVLLPGFCPKISQNLKFGLFWGIFACSGLVLQNSAAHQCTCL